MSSPRPRPLPRRRPPARPHRQRLLNSRPGGRWRPARPVGRAAPRRLGHLGCRRGAQARVGPCRSASRSTGGSTGWSRLPLSGMTTPSSCGRPPSTGPRPRHPRPPSGRPGVPRAPRSRCPRHLLGQRPSPARCCPPVRHPRAASGAATPVRPAPRRPASLADPPWRPRRRAGPGRASRPCSTRPRCWPRSSRTTRGRRPGSSAARRPSRTPRPPPGCPGQGQRTPRGPVRAGQGPHPVARRVRWASAPTRPAGRVGPGRGPPLLARRCRSGPTASLPSCARPLPRTARRRRRRRPPRASRSGPRQQDPSSPAAGCRSSALPPVRRDRSSRRGWTSPERRDRRCGPRPGKASPRRGQHTPPRRAWRCRREHPAPRRPGCRWARPRTPAPR